MENLNHHAAMCLKGTTELKYLQRFKDINELKNKLQEMVNSGWVYDFDKVITPKGKSIYSDTSSFFYPKNYSPIHPDSRNQFHDFINGKISGHEKLRFGERMHLLMNKAYGFHLGMEYLLFENIELPEKQNSENRSQLKLFEN